MGVMENMLHSDSLRTVTSVNGSYSTYSEGRLGKLAMDIGPSKPKRLSVSAFAIFHQDVDHLVIEFRLQSFLKLWFLQRHWSKKKF